MENTLYVLRARRMELSSFALLKWGAGGGVQSTQAYLHRNAGLIPSY
jgi:hypothetical protein